MGVRGLTSYIAKNAEQYLKPYELHDCNLVIDGDCLACNLYKDVTGNYSAFGGDYDDYYRAIVQFFHVLAECNINAYVLMDGGYEQKKLRTVGQRLRGKISVIKRINPCDSITLFPLHMKEVFVDAVKDAGVPIMRCVFEADDELATLSRKLNCPVLSYDSDFYIHNVCYIPLITLTVKAHTKLLKVDGNDEKMKEQLRKNEVKHVQKRTKANKIMETIQVDKVENKTGAKGFKTYKFLDCCMYRIQNLIGRNSLSADKLPLFAALLGNDYIENSKFKNLVTSRVGKNRSRKLKQQQRRIINILQWLRYETTDSAMNKIFARLKKNQRQSLAEQMRAAISGYSNEQCHSYDFFVGYYEHAFKQFVNDEKNQLNKDDYDVLSEEKVLLDEHEFDSNEESGSETQLVIVNPQSCGEQLLSIRAEDVESDEDLESDDDQVQNDKSINSENVNENNSEENLEISEIEEDDDTDEDIVDKTIQFPEWFLKKLYPGHLSRFFVDLLHLRKYINNPQIEHFPFDDCNEIALPILIYIYTLLNCVEGEETKPEISEDGTVLPIDFTYLTRAKRVTNIRYFKYAVESPPKYAFNPNAPNPLLFSYLLESKLHAVNVSELLEKLELLPEHLRLYFISIVYWLNRSQNCDLHHLHALIVCLVVLGTIDSKIPVERDLKAFQKRFGKIIKKERLVRDKESLEGTTRSVKPSLLALTIPARMDFIPKSDCLLVQDRLLPHFHMQEIFKKKYDSYSTIVLHSFAEFQSVVFQMNALNALLDFPYPSPHMGQLYCGVFLYNLYDLLYFRVDVQYYVKKFIFPDSQMMYDFYNYLVEWCAPFVPASKRVQLEESKKSINKKLLKKQRQTARKTAANDAPAASADPYADMCDLVSDNEDDEFFDLNNKFCTFLKIT